VPRAIIAALGEGKYQAPDVVGRSVVCLMAGQERHGQLVYSECGKFKDLEHGEEGFLETTKRTVGVGEDGEENVLGVLGRLKE
jgi:hypothetical protein